MVSAGVSQAGAIPGVSRVSGLMADAQIRFDEEGHSGELVMGDADLAVERGLASSVIMSLFTDRRALPDDRLPFDHDDPRGWWGSAFNTVEMGSRLWLLHREKSTQETLNRAREFCRESLQWMIDEDVADRIDVEASYGSIGVMEISVAVRQPIARLEEFIFQYVWGGT